MTESVKKISRFAGHPIALKTRLALSPNLLRLAVSAFLIVLALLFALEHRSRAQSQSSQSSLLTQTQAEADRKTAGCVTCHVSTDEPTMHPTGTVRLGCVDCHGGDATASIATGTPKDSIAYERAKRQAHPQPRDAVYSRGSANVERPFAKWLHESYEYVRFVNPGDLR